jgi:hypothetical protein
VLIPQAMPEKRDSSPKPKSTSKAKENSAKVKYMEKMFNSIKKKKSGNENDNLLICFFPIILVYIVK